MRCAALAFALLFIAVPAVAAPAPAPPSGVDPSIGKVEVTLDLPKDKPYVGEMIILRMRSFIRAFITLDEIRQPPLINFDWQQLGRDKPIQAMVNGFSVAGVERDIAIFPQHAGRLIIDPFVRHVTVAMDDNRRVEADFASKPVYVDVQNHPATGEDGWWLPAKSLTLTDHWSTAPDEIKPGTLARRTLTVEAVGLTGDRLPPPPKMLAPGSIAFKGPVERTTLITEEGPIARVTYQWDIRPVSTSPARLDSVHIPYFDTTERRMRDAAIPDTWIAYIGTLVHPSHERARSWTEAYFAPGPLMAGCAGFAWTAVLAGFAVTARRRPEGVRRRARNARRLCRAARNHDEAGFRKALDLFARHDAGRFAAATRDPSIAERLAALDAARYSRSGGAPPPLGPLAVELSRRLTMFDAQTAPDRLAALDGPVAVEAATPSWRARVRALVGDR